ncbi:hypothetical protein VNO77_22635 [Canavalia gladiata]|uniref:Uncharacterized protein n=1 Tax=Canavalia gladiata TaxID=3824 RepID=A0AAN9L4D7_CANGL
MAVKMWLHDLRDAVYVADDLLDQVSTEAATHKEVSNFFPLFLNLRDRKVVCEIKDITIRLEYIVKQKDFLGLKEIPSEDFSWRIPSTSLLERSESDIYGRDQDKEKIKKLLLDDNSEDNVSVIPIWGMGGVGKTTLAQWLYNDENLMGNFDLKAWKLRISVKSFEMHDLIHDLVISVAGDFSFRAEELGKADNIKIQTSHLSYERLSHPIKNNFDAIAKLNSLRTFLPMNFSVPSFGFENAALTILSKLVHLRVLSFCNFKELDVLPDSIGQLIHLRYLDFSRAGLTMLPIGMQNLVNLRHLDIRKTHLNEMPQGMSKLRHLQILSYFVVGEHEENGIKELGELSNIHESLWLRNLENVTNSGEAEEARIKDKTHQCFSLRMVFG